VYDLTGLTKLVQNQKRNEFERKTQKPYNVEYLDGAILCTKRHTFNDLNGFDEDYFFYSEEVDFCYRATTKGKYCVIIPSSIVAHHRGGSQENKGMSQKGIQMLINSEELFLSKYKSTLEKKSYFTVELIYFKLLSLIYSILKKNIKSSNCDFYVEAIKNRREINNEV
jgi:GT2 family glycosyltransferase